MENENRFKSFWEEYKRVMEEYIPWVCRNRIRISKGQMKLEWNVKGENKGSCRYTGNKMQNVVLLLNKAEHLRTNGMKKAKALTKFFASVFTGSD